MQWSGGGVEVEHLHLQYILHLFLLPSLASLTKAHLLCSAYGDCRYQTYPVCLGQPSLHCCSIKSVLILSQHPVWMLNYMITILSLLFQLYGLSLP